MTPRTRKLTVGVVGAFLVAVAAVVVKTGERDPIPPVTSLRYLAGGSNAVLQIVNRGRSKLQFRCAAEYSVLSPVRGILEPHERRQVSIPLPSGRPVGLLAVDFKAQSRLPDRIRGLLARLAIHTGRPHTFQTNIAVLSPHFDIPLGPKAALP